MTESTITTDTADGRPSASPAHSGAALFLNKLRAARRRARLSQAAVAARLRRPTSFVGKYENGRRSLDVIEFLEVAEAIGFDPAFLHTLRKQTAAQRSPSASSPSKRRPHSPQPQLTIQPQCPTAQRGPRRPRGRIATPLAGSAVGRHVMMRVHGFNGS